MKEKNGLVRVIILTRYLYKGSSCLLSQRPLESTLEYETGSLSSAQVILCLSNQLAIAAKANKTRQSAQKTAFRRDHAFISS